jgi:hypothetical protein
LVTLDSESINGITGKRKNIIIQYHQLRRQITNEFEAPNISQFPEDSSIMQAEFYFNTQLESINSRQIYKSGMNHSASNTTTNTAAGTTNETNETSNETIDSTLTANSAPKSIKLPIVFIFPLEKVTYELKEFLNNPSEIADQITNSKDKKSLSFPNKLIEILYDVIAIELKL